jgi:hypothetical protein
MTTWLDLIGLLLIVIAVGVAVGLVYVPGGLAAAGVGLILVSWLIDRRRPKQ